MGAILYLENLFLIQFLLIGHGKYFDYAHPNEFQVSRSYTLIHTHTLGMGATEWWKKSYDTIFMR